MRPSQKPSPITIALSAAMILMSGLALFVISRTRSPQIDRTSGATDTPRASDSEAAPQPPRPLTPPPPQRLLEIPAPPPPVSSAIEVAAAAIALPEPEDARRPTDAGDIAQRRRLIAAAHNQLLRKEADERVFENRKVPEETRAAIRRMNAELARSTEDYLARTTESALAASNPEAERIRRAALDSLLGPDEAKAFDTAERLAARALVPRYRRQWTRELHTRD